jgi:U3 small nucleolar RNA-associated protein 25
MAPPKKGGKKTKKKKSGGKKDAWTLDGGTNVAGKKEFVDQETGRRIKQRTQEKDEEKRRGSLKTAYNDQAYALSRKLGQKITFEKFRPAEEGEGEYDFEDYMDDDDDDNDVESGVGKDNKFVRRQSSLSVLNRLQRFSGNNRGSEGSLSSNTKSLVSSFLQSVGSDDDNDNEDSEDGEDVEGEKSSEKGAMKSSSEKGGCAQEQEQVSDNKDEDTARAPVAISSVAMAYDFLFAPGASTGSSSKGKNQQPSSSSGSSSSSKMASMGEVNAEYALHGALRLPESFRGAAAPADFRGDSLSSVFGDNLPKLWRDRQSGMPGAPTSASGARAEEKMKNASKKARSGSDNNTHHDSPEFVAKLLHQLTHYADTLLEGRDKDTDHTMLRTVLIHACVHIIRSRVRVMKHNDKLKKKLQLEKVRKAKAREREMRKKAGLPAEADDDDDDQEGDEEEEEDEDEDEDEDGLPKQKEEKEQEKEEVVEGSIQDQGFVRPRVLILCPFRGVAMRIFELIKEILGENTTIASLDKLVEEYGPPEFSDEEEDDGSEEDDDSEEEDDDGDEEAAEERRRKRKRSKQQSRKHKPPAKPEDWQHDFRQNCDDDFKLGIQMNPGRGKGSGVNKGCYVRLFSDFFISDVIIASPLGLRLIIEKFQNSSQDGEDDPNIKSLSALEKQKKKNEALAMRNADFLSSLEMVVLHQADVMSMQNWDHVEFVMRLVNQLPKSNHDTDFARVKPYFLDGKASEHRQVIFTSHFVSPTLLSSFRTHSKSLCGSLRVKRRWGSDGVISHVTYGTRQVFQRVSTSSLGAEEEDRFAFFKEHILGPLLRTGQGKTLIVTPNYLHYVRVRNELLKLEANSAFVCEYSRESEISRGRSRFFHGLHEILLYSGRCHYFRRFPIKGAQHVIFYSIPEYPRFYPELVNLLTNEQHQSSRSDQSSDHHKISNGASGTACSSMVMFTKYDQMALERIVGSKKAKHMLDSEKGLFMFK